MKENNSQNQKANQNQKSNLDQSDRHAPNKGSNADADTHSGSSRDSKFNQGQSGRHQQQNSKK